MKDTTDKVDYSIGDDGKYFAVDYNDINQELENGVTRSGQTLSQAKTPLQIGRAWFINSICAQSFIVNGLPNAIELTPETGSAGLIFPENYDQLKGAIVDFIVTTPNTSGTVTIDIGQSAGSLIGIKNLKHLDGSDLFIGELNGRCKIRYNHTAGRWDLISAFNISNDYETITLTEKILNILRTSGIQLKLSYDGSNYAEFETDSTGILNISATNKIEFNSETKINSNFTVETTSGIPFTLAYDESRFCYFEVNTSGELIISTTGSSIVIPNNDVLNFGTPHEKKIYSDGDDFYIKNLTLDKDIIFSVNDGSIEKEILRFDADIYKTLILSNLEVFNTTLPQFKIAYDVSNYCNFEVSSSGFLNLSTSSGAVNIINTNPNQFRISYDSDDYTQFSVDIDGNLTIDSKGTDLILADGTNLSFGTDKEVTMTLSGNNLFFNNTAQDKDFSFFVNKGGTNTEIIRIHGSTGFIEIGEQVAASTKVQIRDTGTQLRLAYDFDNNFYTDFIVNSTGDLTIKPVGNDIILEDNKILNLGTGKDGLIYSSSDNLIIKNQTVDKDIIININDGSVDKEILRFDADIFNTAILSTLSITNTSANQFKIAYDGSNYTDFNVNSLGYLTIEVSGDCFIVNTEQIVFTDNITDNNNKIFRIVTNHYDIDEENISGFILRALSTENILDIGGNAVALNACTSIRFYTASNNTTLDGTEQFRIESDGGIFAYNILNQTAVGLTVEWDSTTKELYAETCTLDTKENIVKLTQEEINNIIEITRNIPYYKFDSKNKRDIGMIDTIADYVKTEIDDKLSIDSKLVVKSNDIDENGDIIPDTEKICGINRKMQDSYKGIAIQDLYNKSDEKDVIIQEILNRLNILETK